MARRITNFVWLQLYEIFHNPPVGSVPPPVVDASLSRYCSSTYFGSYMVAGYF